ncbi:glycoside hydrolase family 32 protein [Bacillus sp. FSL M8-0052]|uniref:Glycoside hydrolase family 32 protein n=2 Tax=Bacillaceae TaxID=186817 RepID=A0AAJ3Z1N4_9BACI|nr:MULTISPECIES: glycoside hydrolase family 32 protein [Bacillus]MBU8785649.1 glycoside hydrolase family 32 protein [Bacillus glycinifermentans]MDU0073431.1 glycoside hydrolase family 32 protein [Bacillus sp. IG6]MED8021285.1 glycoside hydrolase family 32 protein [Bacillus glycinifermentans]NUJ15969.1 glycoside hydrolase family 32 protein [Bacillus glycinifermentans]QAT67083.1 glycoside hydrolase family 32 protein [Bacillus glycinifermentans]
MNMKVYQRISVFISCLGVFTAILLPARETEQKGEIRTVASHRAAFHLTAPDKWKNDPQRPVYMNGQYHYYYLYNRDYPDGGGTEWRHAVSSDLVHWKDEGVAIPKYTNKNGDPWSGSVVVDSKNTAGFGKGAVIAIMTQPASDSGQEEQFLWYSKNGGKTFTPYGDDPVLSNPGTVDFRDPKVIWDEQDQKWVMALAEGAKIGFYESHNLKKWRYTGGFLTQNIGTVECPDLFMMRADDGTYKWVLGTSANGKPSGKPNTYAYWTGTFTGKEFKADQEEPKWLDYGFDWYAGVTFEDGESSDQYDKRYAMAWMNNWDYANDTPTQNDGFNGTDSIVREIRLKHDGGNTYSLASQPISQLDQLTVSTDEFEKIEVNGSKTLSVKGDTYMLDADISWSDAKNIGLRLRESADGKRHIDAGICAEDGYSYVNRGFTKQPDKSRTYIESKAPFDANNKKVHVTIIVDKTTVEMFVDDGRVVHSNQAFPGLHDQGITLFAENGIAVFEHLKIKHFQ